MTPKQEAALRQAREALDDRTSLHKWQKAREAIDEVLAEQPAQQQSMEPYSTLNLKATPISGWGQQPIGMSINAEAAIGRNLYISSRPSKPWVGLEESEWREIDDRHDWTTTQGRIDAAEEIEAKLREKNA